MPIPDYQALMLPLLKRAASGEIRVLEAEKQMGVGLLQKNGISFCRAENNEFYITALIGPSSI
jgi:hypothetical protein